MAIDRIVVTPSSQAHSELLSYWSRLEGRSISSLCSSLLEEAVYKAMESGRANKTAVKLMEDVIKQRERSLEVSHQLNLNNEKEKSENIFQSELKPLEDKESEVDKIMNLSARGAFTDFKWNKSDFEHQMTLLDEVLKVMFKGDELKEARVIIHTLIEKYGMNVGISQRGLRDMVEAVELNKSKEDSMKAFKEFVRDWANEIEESIRFMSYRYFEVQK